MKAWWKVESMQWTESVIVAALCLQRTKSRGVVHTGRAQDELMCLTLAEPGNLLEADQGAMRMVDLVDSMARVYQKDVEECWRKMTKCKHRWKTGCATAL